MAGGRGHRVRRWTALSLCIAVLAALATFGSVGLVDRLNPFDRRTVDRSRPPLLQSIRDLSRYHAAVGDFQVVVDVEQSFEHVPLALAGQRTLFVAAGTVDAYVDFSALTDGAVAVSADHRSVQMQLPEPALDKPNLDPDRSYVFDQRRGLLNRLGSLVSTPDQHEFYATAEQRLTEAAKASELTTRARENTRGMLTQLLGSLGFQVTFLPV
jgi:hypothetical protein